MEHLETELNTAVDKIYELRDIIRGLETKVETQAGVESQQNELVRELRVSLEEAMLSQQLVSQELQLLRSSSTDKELVEHIRALEEQLKTKTAELGKQQAAREHMLDIRAQLRAMEERVEQSTRELEQSVLTAEPAGASCSNSSSRVSTPAPTNQLQLLGELVIVLVSWSRVS